MESWGQSINWASYSLPWVIGHAHHLTCFEPVLLGIEHTAKWWDLCSTWEGAEQHSGLMWPLHEGSGLSPGLKSWADDRSTRVCCAAHCRAPETLCSLTQPTSQHMAPLAASAGQGEDKTNTRCQWPHTHWQSHTEATRLDSWFIRSGIMHSPPHPSLNKTFIHCKFLSKLYLKTPTEIIQISWMWVSERKLFST